MPVLVDAIANAVAAASGYPLTGEGGAQRLAEPLGVVTKRTVDELPCRGGGLHRQFVGEGAARGPGKFDVVPHSAPVAR